MTINLPRAGNEVIVENKITYTHFFWTGFSFTRDKYATSISQVTEGLYISLCQFFELFPNYKQAKFYITGESFAGIGVDLKSSYNE